MVGALTMSYDARQLQMCEKCFNEEVNNIKIALHLKLITLPIVGDINKCGLCHKQNKNIEDGSVIFKPYDGSCVEEQESLDRFSEACDISGFSIRVYPDDE